MIDNLLTEFTLGTVGRLLGREVEPEEADYQLARLISRLSSDTEETPNQTTPQTGGRTAFIEIISTYLQLSVSDLTQIDLNIHEWVLERLSNDLTQLGPDLESPLHTIYFLFGSDNTLRHDVVGVLMQLDDQAYRSRDYTSSPIRTIAELIANDEGMQDENREQAVIELAGLVIDFADGYSGPVGRGLESILQANVPERGEVMSYIQSWSIRLGGEIGEMLGAITRRWNDHREE